MFQNVYRLNVLNVLTLVQCCQAAFAVSLPSFQRPAANSTKDLNDGRWTNRSDLGLQNCCQDSERLDGALLQSVE